MFLLGFQWFHAFRVCCVCSLDLEFGLAVGLLHEVGLLCWFGWVVLWVSLLGAYVIVV